MLDLPFLRTELGSEKYGVQIGFVWSFTGQFMYVTVMKIRGIHGHFHMTINLDWEELLV